jgi:DNA-binding LacI/PurR family transcriptional regulator
MSKKRTTMSDIAKAAGVSRTTVSFVLNNLPDSNIPEMTRQRVLLAAQQLDYVPNTAALNLATGRTMMIALVVRKTHEQFAADSFLSEFIHGVMETAEPQGYHLMMHAARSNESANYRDLIRSRKADGLIISSPLIHDPEIRQLHDEKTPLVLNGSSDYPDIPSVDVDNIQGSYSAVTHLIELGHRCIGHISNAPFKYTAASLRLTGYQNALAQAGIVYDQTLVFEGDFTDTSGYTPMRALMDLPDRPTAVFVGSDTVALGAFQAVNDCGLKVPDDISIIGFDNIYLGKYLHPPLTTVHLPAFELGKQAGDTIIKAINAETMHTIRVLLPTQLIIRSSTRRLID